MTQRKGRVLRVLLGGSLALLVLSKQYLVAKATNTILYCPTEYISICEEMQEKYEVSSSLLIAIIQAESSCRPGVISSVGAVGLMQVHPINNPDNLDLTDPRTNIELGTQVLMAWKEQATDEDILLTLSLYEGWGKTAYKQYRKENWSHKCFDYAHKVLDSAHEIDIIRYGQ